MKNYSSKKALDEILSDLKYKLYRIHLNQLKEKVINAKQQEEPQIELSDDEIKMLFTFVENAKLHVDEGRVKYDIKNDPDYVPINEYDYSNKLNCDFEYAVATVHDNIVIYRTSLSREISGDENYYTDIGYGTFEEVKSFIKRKSDNQVILSKNESVPSIGDLFSGSEQILDYDPENTGIHSLDYNESEKLANDEQEVLSQIRNVKIALLKLKLKKMSKQRMYDLDTEDYPYNHYRDDYDEDDGDEYEEDDDYEWDRDSDEDTLTDEDVILLAQVIEENPELSNSVGKQESEDGKSYVMRFRNGMYLKIGVPKPGSDLKVFSEYSEDEFIRNAPYEIKGWGRWEGDLPDKSIDLDELFSPQNAIDDIDDIPIDQLKAELEEQEKSNSEMEKSAQEEKTRLKELKNKMAEQEKHEQDAEKRAELIARINGINSMVNVNSLKDASIEELELYAEKLSLLAQIGVQRNKQRELESEIAKTKREIAKTEQKIQ